MDKRLKSILVSLAIIIMQIMAFTVHATAADIGRVYATITLPVADMHPVFEGISGNESKYTVKDVSFRKKNANSNLKSTDTFVSGETYRIFVQVLPRGDYAAQKTAFSESTTAKVNGLDAAYWSVIDNGTSVLYLFSLEYTVPDASVTITLPVADEHPVFEGISGNESKYTVLSVDFRKKKASSDLKSTDTFVGGETYRISVRILPTGDYAAQQAAFSNISTAKVNGLDAAYWSVIDNGTSAFYIFSLEYTVPIVSHLHEWSYTANGATITATCESDGCNINKGLTLTISAPTDLIYDGNAKAATLNTDYSKTAFPDGPYTITYYQGDKNIVSANVRDAGAYKAKVTAGKGNGAATASVDFNIARNNPAIIVLPIASEITFGDALSASTLSDGDASVPGTFAWKDGNIKPSVADSNVTDYTVVFTPDDNMNYAAVSCKVKVKVNKATVTVTTAPATKDLRYNTSAQELVTAGEATGGTMQYAIGKEATTPPTKGWTSSVPTGTDVGTYYVWYKVIGDKDHIDSNVLGPIKAVIKAAEPEPESEKPVSIKDVKVVLKSTTLEYNGKNQKPVVKTIKGLKLKEGTDYTISIKNSKGDVVKSYKARGKYTLVIKGKGNYTGVTQAEFEIVKGKNTLNVTAKKTVNIAYSKLNDKNQTIKKKKIYNFKKKGKGKITYTLSSVKKGKKSFKKYFAVSKKGNLTIRKGLKKDTYTVKIKVKAAGNKNYRSATKTVTFKVKVR